MKAIVNGLMAKLGYELCRLSSQELQQLPAGQHMNYKEAQSYRALSGMGQLSLAEARFLGELVAASDPHRPIIEIGALFGHSTMVLALFKKEEQQLISVDNFSWNPLGISSEVHHAVTKKRLDEAINKQNTALVFSDKEDFYQQYDGPAPSLFFCDANHSYEATCRDIEWAKSVGASIICGDDYDLGTPSPVERAVDEHGGAARVVEGLFLLRESH